MKIKILDQYRAKFGNPEIYIKSPGRANIIGEHTDYNHGLVLPFAIQQCLHLYLGQNNKGVLRIFALDINEYETIDISQIQYQKNGWTRYFVNALIAMGYDHEAGIDVVFGGNLPQGGGVSSSSAITCGFIAGVNALFEYNLTDDQMISLASQAENGIGLNGGIMDQTAIFKGKSNQALLIDFLDHSIQYVDMPDESYSFYLFNSGQKHNLVNTEYNQRRSTCEQALAIIQDEKPNVQTLRDVSFYDMAQFLKSDLAIKRCTHVLEENERVLSTLNILKEKEYEKLGPLLLDSHRSLANNYEVSTDEIDYLVQRSQQIPNVLGSRIMGGGFGGCTINFVQGRLGQEDLNLLSEDYKNETRISLKVEEVGASDGVRVQPI